MCWRKCFKHSRMVSLSRNSECQEVSLRTRAGLSSPVRDTYQME